MSALVELAHPRKLIPRWEKHGDLWIFTQDGTVYVRADQLEQLAGITPWSTGETLIEDHWPTMIDGHPFYELDTAVARCEAEETALAAEFLTWLREQLELLLTDEALDQAQRIPSHFGSYSVNRAAKILDRDPAIRIGMHGLFAHMQLQGWITRAEVDSDWTITPLAHRHGWLTLRNVIIPAATKVRRRTYPQVYVTPAGLDELRTTLHALLRSPPDEPTHPTLFD